MAAAALLVDLAGVLSCEARGVTWLDVFLLFLELIFGERRLDLLDEFGVRRWFERVGSAVLDDAAFNLSKACSVAEASDSL